MPDNFVYFLKLDVKFIKCFYSKYNTNLLEFFLRIISINFTYYRILYTNR